MKLGAKSPQTLSRELYNHIPRPTKAAFFAAFLGGMLIHLYRLCNFAMVVETPYYFYHIDNRADHGCWFLHVVTNLTSWLDMPYLNGIVAVFYLAIAIAIVVYLLGVQQKGTAALIGILFIASPPTASLMQFSYLADGFAMSMLLAVLAVFWVQKSTKERFLIRMFGIIMGAVSLCLSLGTYQANLDVAALLCVLLLLQKLLQQKTSPIRQFFRFLGMGVGGVTLYLVVTQIILIVTKTSLTEHAGINAMGTVNITASLKALFWIYLDSSHPYMNLLTYPTALCWQLFGWLGVVTLGLTMLMRLVQEKLYLKPMTLVFYSGLLAAIPAAMWLLYIVQPQVGNRNSLQGMSSILLWVALLTFAEQSCSQKQATKSGGDKLSSVLQWLAWISCIALTIHFVVFSNQAYMIARVSYERDMAACNRLLGRMEQVEGYTPEATVCIQGKAVRYAQDSGFSALSEKINHYFPSVQANSSLYGETSYLNFFNTFLNTAFVQADEQQRKSLLQNEAYTAMPEWPADGSIKMMDGILVIRLSE